MRGFPGERPLAVWARAGVAAFAGVVSVAGCAVGIVDDSPPDGPSEVDGAVPTEAGTGTDTGALPDARVDAAVKDVVAPPPDVVLPVDTGPPPDAGGCTNKIVINEVQTEGTAADNEFVELFNPTPCEVLLEGWSLKYSAVSGNTPSTFFTGLSSHKLLSGGYFVVAHTSFSGAKNATYSAGKLAADDGQVGLFDKLDDKVDAVGYGTIAAGNRVLTESNPAPSPGGTGKSVQRVPNGADTNNNQADFRSANSTPNAAN